MVYIVRPEDMDKYFEAAKKMVGEGAQPGKTIPLEKQAEEKTEKTQEMEDPPKGVVY